jgi:putative transposase
MSTQDIQAPIDELCDVAVSPTMISNVTHKLMPVIQEWHSYPLASEYAIQYYRCHPLESKANGCCMNKAAYMVILALI